LNPKLKKESKPFYLSKNKIPEKMKQVNLENFADKYPVLENDKSFFKLNKNFNSKKNEQLDGLLKVDLSSQSYKVKSFNSDDFEGTLGSSEFKKI
jgi:hypothetical protein